MNFYSTEIRNRFLNFFEQKNHIVTNSVSLIPENNSSVLFIIAGMQPLTPFLLGKPHPKGKRIVNIQKCIRTNDIEEIGDNTHLTFFEMLGNWSLGDYFKKDAIEWAYNFLIDKSIGLGLNPKRLYITVFEGNENVKADNESYQIWVNIFKKAGLNPKKRIFWLGVKNNWWAPGDNGPCGPDTEIFYDKTENGLGDLTKEKFLEFDKKQDLIEIWNLVFMEYESKNGKIICQLKNKNVDTGSGLERLVSILQKKESPFETDLFLENLKFLQENSNIQYKDNKKEFRIILDHIRTAIFLIGDDLVPSNKEQGYILRRLIRRAVVKMKNINFSLFKVIDLIKIFIENYKLTYPILKEKEKKILNEINKEIEKFNKTLIAGMKEFNKITDSNYANNNIKKLKFGECNIIGSAINEITGEDAFKLFSSYGIPLDIIYEEAEKKCLFVNSDDFYKKLKEHTKQSQTAATGKFKGGLVNENEKIKALHTSTHLLLAGLIKYLGNNVIQAGSNITEERLRFDFTYENKVERKTLDKVEEYVNQSIEAEADILVEEMTKEKAKTEKVVGAFWDKYPDIVKIWTIKNKDGIIYSRELCNGPHMKNTKELKKFGKFKIINEKSSSFGVRRIKANFVL